MGKTEIDGLKVERARLVDRAERLRNAMARGLAERDELKDFVNQSATSSLLHGLAPKDSPLRRRLDALRAEIFLSDLALLGMDWRVSEIDGLLPAHDGACNG